MKFISSLLDGHVLRKVKVKGKAIYSSSKKRCLRAVGQHMPYGITVSPATRHKWTRPALAPASKLVLDLHTPESWKAVFN